MGQPAVAGAEAASCPAPGERGCIHAEGCEEQCDMVAPDIGGDSAPGNE